MTINEYQQCLGLSNDQLKVQVNASDFIVDKNVSYQKMTNVTRVTVGDREFFFFKDDRLQMIYISNEELTRRLWDEFKKNSNPQSPETTLRSRAGKTSNQLVFAAQGIAASITHGEVDFIEIFPPCSLQDYLENIYDEPGKFIR